MQQVGGSNLGLVPAFRREVALINYVELSMFLISKPYPALQTTPNLSSLFLLKKGIARGCV